MFKKEILIFYSLFLSVSAMESPNSHRELNTVSPLPIFFQTISKIDNDFLNRGIDLCIYEAQKYYDFEEDFLIFAKTQLNQDLDYLYNINDIGDHLNKISDYKQHIVNIKNGIEKIDDVLFYFLNNRLNYLKCRDEERIYRPCFISNQERKKNKLNAEGTFFQFSNCMITLLYQLTSPCDLSVKTRKYIRLSPSLWPLLNGKTEDLSLPDMAKEDLNSFNNYLCASERMAITYLGYNPKTVYHRVTPYERSLYDKSWENYGKINDLPYPDWLNPSAIKKQCIDLQLKETSFIINDNYIETTLINDNPKTTECFSEEKDHSETVQLINDTDGTSTKYSVPDSVQEKVLEAKVPMSKKSKLFYKREKRNEQIREILKKKNSTSQSNVKILAPRGMRIFHSRLSNVSFETQILIDDLTGKHRQTLNAIFDPERYVTVSYKSFKSLWKKINGPNSINESTGSSHKVLLDKNRHTVTGVFAHNDNMCYTKNTISYIRYALKLIGFEVEL